jgi:hypothetical protein
MKRREALLSVAGAASIGLAGCTDDSTSGDGTDDEPAGDDTEGGTGATAEGTATGTDAGTTDDGSMGDSTDIDGDPDGEIRMDEGLGLEILEYGHVIRDREEDSRSDYDEAYDVQGRLELTADVYVNVQIAYEFLDDAGERLSYYETTKLMQQGDVWEFSGAYSKSPEAVDGYVLYVSCRQDCSA